MTRKDYELIARTLRELDIEFVERRRVALALSEAFAEENNRFDSAKFITASGADY